MVKSQKTSFFTFSFLFRFQALSTHSVSYVFQMILFVSRILWFNKRNIWLNLTHIDLTVIYAELYC